MRLRGCDLVPPVGRELRLWTLLVCSSELDQPSKTGEFDDSVIWDHVPLQFMTSTFASLHQRGKRCLWDFGYVELGNAVKSVVAELGVQNLVLYSLRHSGASWDASSRRRSLQEVQKRGRWRTH